MSENKRQWTEAEIRAKLASDPKWVAKALLRLYERQTEYEQQADHTINHNLRGFQPCDAYMFTQYAKWLLRGKSLTPKQLAYCGVETEESKRLGLRIRKWRGEPCICKYARQLLKVIEEKRAASVGTPLPPTVPQGDDFNRRWVEHKNEFARREAEQEAEAYRREYESELA